MINFQNPQFLRSTWSTEGIDGEARVVAFAGRSNAGKSSVLNALCGGRFARTARLPGRTRAINLFALHSGQLLADLPGYGYAAVARDEQRQWGPKLVRFLQSPHLHGVVLVVDCRRGLLEKDEALLALVAHVPTLVLMNKIDKLGRAALRQCLSATQVRLQQLSPSAQVQAFSATQKTGVPEAQKTIGQLMTH